MQKEKRTDLGGNAKTAFSELAAMVGLGKEAAVEADAPAAESVHSPAAPTTLLHTKVAAPASSAPVAPGKTIIAAGTIIDGNIRTENSLDCFGKVKGDIVSKGTVTIMGDHTGNIHGNTVVFREAVIHGNIVAEGQVSIGSDTQITGDIQAGGVVLAGTVTGNVQASSLITFHKTAMLTGNVQAARIAVEEGAQISGEVKMGASPATNK